MLECIICIGFQRIGRIDYQGTTEPIGTFQYPICLVGTPAIGFHVNLQLLQYLYRKILKSVFCIKETLVIYPPFLGYGYGEADTGILAGGVFLQFIHYGV